MWRLVAPGGVLAITTWGPGFAEPGSGQFWETVRAVAPSLYKAYNPWDEITSTAALTELLTRAGVARPTVTAVAGQHHIGYPDQFWDIVLGSGYRATVDALSQDQRDTVRERLLARLRAAGVTTLRADVVFGTAERPR